MNTKCTKRLFILLVTLLIAVFSIASFSCKPDQLSAAVAGVLEVPAPVFSEEGGTYTQDLVLEIINEMEGVTIYYTLDGSDPTLESTAYTEPIIIAGDGTEMTIKAIAAFTDMQNSPVISATFVIAYEPVAEPEFSVESGFYNDDLTVSVTCATEGATIYYTDDGTPVSEDSRVYDPESPFIITGPDTEVIINAFAECEGMQSSDTVSKRYTVNYTDVAKPVFSPGGGSYASDQTITMSCTTSGAEIYYKFNEPPYDENTLEPLGDATLYSTGISLTGGNDATIFAYAIKTGMEPSSLTFASYQFVPDITVGEGDPINATYTNGTNSFNFGTVLNDDAGNIDSTATFTIRNDGADTLTGISITLTGTDADEYSIGGSVPNLTPGASATFTVTFDPISYGLLDDATVEIGSDDPVDNPFCFGLTGIGKGDTIYISPTGSSTNSGYSPSDPLDSIQNGIDKAVAESINAVKVSGGTYDGRVTMAAGIAIEGGYNSTFTARDQTSILTKSDGSYIVVSGDSGIGNDSVLDGFRLESTPGVSNNGISIGGGSSPTISNNEIFISYTTTDSVCPVAIYIGPNYAACSPIIRDNEMTIYRPNGTGTFSARVMVVYKTGSGSDILIERNKIYGYGNSNRTVGIRHDKIYGTVTIKNNFLSVTTSSTEGVLYFYDLFSGANAIISNNTIVRNGGYGIWFSSGSGSMTIVNNIICSPTSSGTGISGGSTNRSIGGNLFFNLSTSITGSYTNLGSNSSPGAVPFTTVFSSSYDSDFSDGHSTDYHLNDPSNTYAVDQGIDASGSSYGAVSDDIDGDPRSGTYDRGADER